jgi:type II secretory pathway pseudopilin PulG
MRGALDFTSWQTMLSTLIGLVIVSLIAVGVRLLVMQSVQQRRERANRQINERLKTLIAAYKTLGGSFTGTLAVDPRHLRELRQLAEPGTMAIGASDRARRMRDAVEAALSDIILLGTDEQVRLAAQAAQDMVTGKPVETAALVTSLRDFIREVLELDPIPASVVIPKQGPLRPAGSGAGKSGGAGGREGGSRGGGGGAAGAGGLGAGLGLGAAGSHAAAGTQDPDEDPAK